MFARLVKQTGPKILKSLEANVRAIESDKLTQEASFSLEKQRLERIRRNIEHCTVKAPGDGIVVYVNQSNRWGMASSNIDQGVTLRQDQPIFNLPDPKHMRVKAKINESKVSMVHTGQAVSIQIDAYPGRPLRGVVAELMPISIPLMGSDVRVYYANVDILDGFDDLRPGLSAMLVFEVESRQSVTRVPVEAVRWVDEEPYVALQDHSAAEEGRQPWKWQRIQIGLSDESFAEVLNGLKVGDRVVSLPASSLPQVRISHERRTSPRYRGIPPAVEGVTLEIATMPSPFPGMNPYIEQDAFWQDFHLEFLPAIRERLVAQVRPKYIVMLDEHIYVHELPPEPRRLVGPADVSLAAPPAAGR